MKVFYRKLVSTLFVVLLGLTVFASQSAHANCLINMVMEDGRTGFVGCGSSAGPYAMLHNGTDVTDEIGGELLSVFCDAVCPDGYLISDAGRSPSKRFIWRYPTSYHLARARFLERQQLRLAAAWSPFVGGVTVYDSVLCE